MDESNVNIIVQSVVFAGQTKSRQLRGKNLKDDQTQMIFWQTLFLGSG